MEKLYEHELTYKIDELNKTVVAYFNVHSQQDVWEMILLDTVDKLKCPLEDSGKYDIIDKVLSEFPKKFGRAHCIPTDTFDISVGKRLARQNLLNRIQRARYKVVNELMNKYYNTTGQFEDKANNLLGKLYGSTHKPSELNGTFGCLLKRK